MFTAYLPSPCSRGLRSEGLTSSHVPLIILVGFGVGISPLDGPFCFTVCLGSTNIFFFKFLKKNKKLAIM